VVDIGQLERGIVRVGDIEHLGRLFDRDPSVDRDAVVVLAETSTQELIAGLANSAIATVHITAYRHHPSGVHRWFVAPLDPAAVTRPVSAVAQLDSTVVDDLPGLPFDHGDAAELVIEWDDEIDDTAELHLDLFELSLDLVDDHTDSAGDPVDEPEVDTVETVDTVDDQAYEPIAEPTLEPLDLPAPESVAASNHETNGLIDLQAPEPFGATDDSGADDAGVNDFKFSIVWPDGSEEPAAPLDAADAESFTSLDESAEVDVEVAPDALVADDDLEFTESDDGEPQFSMPPLELGDEPDSADTAVPDDVAEAVRRAIAAIESASVNAPEVAPSSEPSVLLGELVEVAVVGEPMISKKVASPAPTVQPPAEAPAGLGGFAPPTMEMRAEVMYAQMEAEVSSGEAAAVRTESSPSSGVASVVFVDDPADDSSEDGGDERSSALRRLIGNLRRRDH
jgi:hypothetical protein